MRLEFLMFQAVKSMSGRRVLVQVKPLTRKELKAVNYLTITKLNLQKQ